MAVDEALLAAAIEDRAATLRLYQWGEPTLSLGYFQRYDDRRQHATSRECAVVRRPSGGGALLHDRELTYSLALPAEHPLARDAHRLYATVHQILVDTLSAWLPKCQSAWTLRIHSKQVDADNGPSADNHGLAQPFLCFQRRFPGDVLLASATDDSAPRGQDWKIIGSAQRRRGRAILQHGSLLLERSPAAPELLGWADLTGLPVSYTELVRQIARRFSAKLAVDAEPTTLPGAICDAARGIERAKYASTAWTRRR